MSASGPIFSSRHGTEESTQGARAAEHAGTRELEVARVHQSTQVPVIASVYRTTISQCSVLRHAAWQSFRAPARLQMPVSKSSSQPTPTLELPLQTLLASSRGGGGSQYRDMPATGTERAVPVCGKLRGHRELEPHRNARSYRCSCDRSSVDRSRQSTCRSRRRAPGNSSDQAASPTGTRRRRCPPRASFGPRS
jgi:hypothetical protein